MDIFLRKEQKRYMEKSVSVSYQKKLLQLLKDSGYDAVLLAPSEELAFFTGFSPMMCERFQGYFLTAKGDAFYFCNLLYTDQMREAYENQIPVYSWFDGDGMLGSLEKVLLKYGLIGAKILVNEAVQAFQVLDISEAFDVKFYSGKQLLEEVRIRKSGAELDGLRGAAWIADMAFKDVIKFIRPGVRETDIRKFLMESMRQYGGCDCGAMVASGPNAGYPHYFDGKRVIQKADMVILDYGCVYHGMHSDMTRTVFVHEIPEKWGRIYDIVDEAQLAGQNAAYKGAYVPDIDHAARRVIEEAGYGGDFPYRLGHGIGYSVHEAPYIHGNNRMYLDTGMAFSVEPGIYLPGDGGIRIENTVIINEEGKREILNQASREKIICRNE